MISIISRSREGGNPASSNDINNKRDPRVREGDWIRIGWTFLISAILATPAAAQDKAPPYWASIASGEAMMRTGPARNYPGTWLYQRRDLPVRVIQTYPNWRKIVDPDGQEGWMLVSLLSARRTGLVKPGAPRDLRTKPDVSAPVRYRAEAGVVGRIDHCDGRWCHFEVGQRAGYIAQGDLAGLDRDERID